MSAAWPLAIASTSMIAHQVGGKAIRDSLFFSTFSMPALPQITAVTIVPTILLALAAPRVIRRFGPGQTITWAFLVSATLHLVEWALWATAQREAVAAMLYIHFMTVPILTSGFWAVLSEGGDPRASRRKMAQAAVTASVGGVLGALLARETDVMLMIPLLAGFHLFCAVATYGLRATDLGGGARLGTTGPSIEPVNPQVARRAANRAKPYLASVAIAVAVLATSAAVLDYYFKSQVKLAHPGLAAQKDFYSLFYLATSLVSLGLQMTLGRLAIKRLGLVGTSALLPISVTLGGGAVLIAPGLATAALAFGSERVLRNSLFRAAYEPLYNAVPAREKNAVKTVVDVGSERAGDLVGYTAASALGALSIAFAGRFQAILAMILGMCALLLSRTIHARYMKCLSENFVDDAIRPDTSMVLDAATLSVLMGSHPHHRPETQVPPRSPAILDRITALGTGDIDALHRELGGDRPIPPELVAFVIPLLAREGAVHRVALDALRRVAPARTGQLIDELLNPAADLAVRCRIPRVLIGCTSARAVEGLVAGLEDDHFEIRLHCGRGLVRMRELHPHLHLDKDVVFARIASEVNVEWPVWRVRQHVDARGDAPDASPLLDEKLRKRGDRSLEHVFNLMSLVLPNEPVRLAFRALHTDDPGTRGTALEYLEAVLPRQIRDRLWRFIEAGSSAGHELRSLEIAIDALRAQHNSVEGLLTDLERKPQPGDQPPRS